MYSCFKPRVRLSTTGKSSDRPRAESDHKKLMQNRKTLHKAKNEDLDHVLMEWIRQHRSEHMSLDGLMVMKQAKL